MSSTAIQQDANSDDELASLPAARVSSVPKQPSSLAAPVLLRQPSNTRSGIRSRVSSRPKSIPRERTPVLHNAPPAASNPLTAEDIKLLMDAAEDIENIATAKERDAWEAWSIAVSNLALLILSGLLCLLPLVSTTYSTAMDRHMEKRCQADNPKTSFKRKWHRFANQGRGKILHYWLVTSDCDNA